MPDLAPTFSNAHPLTGGLNPAFLLSRRIVVMDRTDELLTVGCVGIVSKADRAALEFATGVEVLVSDLPSGEVEARLARLSCEPERLGQSATPSHPPATGRNSQAAVPLDEIGGASLLDLAVARLRRLSPSYTPFKPLAELLEAGYTPQEAGDIVIGTEHPVPALDPALRGLAGRLSGGASLGDAIAQEILIPRWLRLGLMAVPNEAEQVSAFVRLSAFDRAMASRSAETRSLRFEIAMLCLPSVLAWFLIASWAGIVVGALVLAVAVWLRDLSAGDPGTDATRAQVLGMTGIAASLNLSATAAIRLSMARLDAVSPTWGTLPDTREGLASALALSPSYRALLMKGALGEAAARMANLFEEKREVKMARSRWLVRRVAVCLFATALAVLVVR